MKIALATGGFDPLHSGHIEYFKAARTYGDILIVGINSDDWLTRKKGRAFMPWGERYSIISNLSMVHQVVDFNDDTNNSIHCIQKLLDEYPEDEIVFVNGGDRDHTNVPEQVHFKNNPRVTFEFGVGGNDKRNSSRWILDEWKAPRTDRVWGHYRVIHETGKTFKAKELVVESGKTLSMQKHERRAEFWFVAEGYATVYTLDSTGKEIMIGVFGQHQDIWIPRESWHRLVNETKEPLRLIELQYGEECSETDIMRR
jgi:D-beta-D-heptose 7-phosphate kinase/D-beta-D-heptose 1-phosphate adenosyltransferase